MSTEWETPALFFHIQDIISRHTPLTKEQIVYETNLVHELQLDSLSFIELIVEVEKDFDLSVSFDEVEDVQTVGELVEYVRCKLMDRHNKREI